MSSAGVAWLRRAAAFAAAFLASLFGIAVPAIASSGGTINSTSGVTAVAWGVAPAATSVSTVPPCRTSPGSCGPFTSSGLAPWYFNVWNTGTVTLTGVSYTIPINGGVVPSITLNACSVPWTTGLSPSCSGTQTLIVNNAGSGTYQVSVAVPASAGSEVYIQATAGGLPLGITITTSVSSGAPRQIRASSVTNG